MAIIMSTGHGGPILNCAPGATTATILTAMVIFGRNGLGWERGGE